jgi:hypothetical protein
MFWNRPPAEQRTLLSLAKDPKTVSSEFVQIHTNCFCRLVKASSDECVCGLCVVTTPIGHAGRATAYVLIAKILLRIVTINSFRLIVFFDHKFASFFYRRDEKLAGRIIPGR